MTNRDEVVVELADRIEERPAEGRGLRSRVQRRLRVAQPAKKVRARERHHRQVPEVPPGVRPASRRTRVLLTRLSLSRPAPSRRATPPTDEELARLFDDRPSDERVAADDWFPMGDGWRDIYAAETLGQRRRWFSNLVEGGDL